MMDAITGKGGSEGMVKGFFSREFFLDKRWHSCIIAPPMGFVLFLVSCRHMKLRLWMFARDGFGAGWKYCGLLRSPLQPSKELHHFSSTKEETYG